MNKQNSVVNLVARASTSRTRLLRGGFSYEELGPRPEVFTTSVCDTLLANKAAGVPSFGQYVSLWPVSSVFSNHIVSRVTNANSAIASVLL